VREELKRRDARDRQQVAFKEAQQVWSDLGYPALKGRILEIVGLQAVENIFAPNRYDQLIPSMQDLLKGKYGRLHTPVKIELQARALGLAEATSEETASAEGQLLSRPDLEREEDVLTYSLFPEEAETFFYIRSQGPRPTPPVAEAPDLFPIQTPFPKSRLIINHKGEEVEARLQGVGSRRRTNKQVLFINIQDHIEEIEVQLVPVSGRKPDYLITFHGETYRLRVAQKLAKEQEYTPVLLEINGQMEEFLIKES
jgi:hypothetical protein